MMTCRDAAERITALVDGELPQGERAALESHLAGCPACREALAAEEEVARRVRSLGRPPLPGGFREAVMGRVLAATPPSAAAPRPRGLVIPLWTWIAAGSAAAAGILAMATWGDGGLPGARTVAGGAPPPAAKPASALVAAEAEGEESREGPLAKSDDDAGGAVPSPREPAPATVPAPEAEARAKSREMGPPAPAAPAPAPEKDQAREERARENEAPPADPDATAGEEKGQDPPKDEPKVQREDVPQAHARLAVFYRTLNPADAEQKVDRVLFVHRDLALEQVGWKDASEVDSPLGRLLRDLADVGQDVQSPGFAAGRTRDRVLQVRVRSRDLDRLRREFGKIDSMREASTVVLAESSGLAPAEIDRAMRASLDELARKEAAAEGAAGAGARAAREPGEPAPPPLPSKELLKRLAGGVSPPRAGSLADSARAPEAEEVWVEIHVVTSPPPK